MWAQNASVSGLIRDASGAVVPNAVINITSNGTGVSRSTVSNESGTYSLPDLLPNVYSMEVSAPGFKSETRAAADP